MRMLNKVSGGGKNTCVAATLLKYGSIALARFFAIKDANKCYKMSHEAEKIKEKKLQLLTYFDFVGSWNYMK